MQISTKPSIRVKTLNTVLIISIVLAAIIAAGALYYLFGTRKSEEKLPAGISSFDVKTGNVEFATPGSTSEELKKTNEQEALKIKKLTGSYLDKIFIEKNTKTEDLKSMFIETANPSPDKFIEKSLQNDIKEKESVIVKGESTLKNLLIAYDKNLKPVTAVSNISIVSKIISRTDNENNDGNKKAKYQYDIKLGGVVMFEPSGDEWRFSRFNLKREFKKYEVTEK